jgi:hypothetical protein
MDVVLVEAWVVAVTGKLNLELLLGHGQLTNRARSPDAWPSPGAISGTGGEPTVLDRCAGLFA